MLKILSSGGYAPTVIFLTKKPQKVKTKLNANVDIDTALFAWETGQTSTKDVASKLTPL